MSAWVFYVLRCSDGSYYAGITNNLRARLARHNDGTGSKYVRSRRPAEIVFELTSDDFDKNDAAYVERRFKLLPRPGKYRFMCGEGKVFDQVRDRYKTVYFTRWIDYDSSFEGFVWGSMVFKVDPKRPNQVRTAKGTEEAWRFLVGSNTETYALLRTCGRPGKELVMNADGALTALGRQVLEHLLDDDTRRLIELLR